MEEMDSEWESGYTVEQPLRVKAYVLAVSCVRTEIVNLLPLLYGMGIFLGRVGLGSPYYFKVAYSTDRLTFCARFSLRHGIKHLQEFRNLVVYCDDAMLICVLWMKAVP
jgi:hypothetical protein